MRPTILAVFIVLVLPWAAPAADKNGQFNSRGVGARTCADYLAARDQRGAGFFLYRSWLNGYLTAYNQFNKETYDIAPDATIEWLGAAAASVCRDNLDQQFWTAVFGLTQALRPDRLFIKNPVVSLTSEGRTVRIYLETVRRVQRALAARGYPVGAADGVIGRQSRGALKAFQRAENLPETGLPDAPTRIRLLRSGGAKPPG